MSELGWATWMYSIQIALPDRAPQKIAFGIRALSPKAFRLPSHFSSDLEMRGCHWQPRSPDRQSSKQEWPEYRSLFHTYSRARRTAMGLEAARYHPGLYGSARCALCVRDRSTQYDPVPAPRHEARNRLVARLRCAHDREVLRPRNKVWSQQ